MDSKRRYHWLDGTAHDDTGGLIELAMRKINKVGTRVWVILGILIVLFLVWAELAVGIFGTPFAGS